MKHRMRYWLSWLSPLDPVWLWHALLDGTPLCRCEHSAGYRELRDKIQRRTGG